MERNPPVLHHNSRGRSTSACNCGRKQAPRDDPFDAQGANYDFYQVRMYRRTLYFIEDIHIGITCNFILYRRHTYRYHM